MEVGEGEAAGRGKRRGESRRRWRTRREDSEVEGTPVIRDGRLLEVGKEEGKEWKREGREWERGARRKRKRSAKSKRWICNEES